MATLSTWSVLALMQLGIFMTIGIAGLGWFQWRQRRQTRANAAAEPQPVSSDRSDSSVRRFLESELTRTRAQMEENDRDLPEHVLQLRINYLQAELEGLAYDREPDRFWSHMCDRIDLWIASASAPKEKRSHPTAGTAKPNTQPADVKDDTTDVS